MQGERKVSVLMGITILFTLHVFGIYWWYRKEDLSKPLIMIPPEQIPPFWHAIFIIMINGNNLFFSLETFILKLLLKKHYPKFSNLYIF